MNKAQKALEFRKAMQLFLATMDAETQAEAMMGVASAFPKYEVGKKYKAKSENNPADVFRYGVNAVGDAQLYMVLQDHTSAEEWKPDKEKALYKPVGITEEGYPEWSQPLGASDAYELGDVVSYKGNIWECTEADAGGKNSWEPGVFGWTIIEG